MHTQAKPRDWDATQTEPRKVKVITTVYSHWCVLHLFTWPDHLTCKSETVTWFACEVRISLGSSLPCLPVSSPFCHDSACDASPAPPPSHSHSSTISYKTTGTSVGIVCLWRNCLSLVKKWHILISLNFLCKMSTCQSHFIRKKI